MVKKSVPHGAVEIDKALVWEGGKKLQGGLKGGVPSARPAAAGGGGRNNEKKYVEKPGRICLEKRRGRKKTSPRNQKKKKLQTGKDKIRKKG